MDDFPLGEAVVGRLDAAARHLMGLSIALIPFNGLPYLTDRLHEMSYEAAVYPMAAAAFAKALSLISARRGSIPRTPSATIALAFFVWAGFASLLNAHAIASASFGGRTGSGKFIGQAIIMTFGALATLTAYGVVSSVACIERYFIRWTLIAMSMVLIYGVCEVSYLQDWHWARRLVPMLDPYLRCRTSELIVSARITGLGFEPSFLGITAALLIPWMCLFVLVSKWRARICGCIGLAIFTGLIAYSFSRTAYLTIVVQVSLTVVCLVSWLIATLKTRGRLSPRMGVMIGVGAGFCLAVACLLGPHAARVLRTIDVHADVSTSLRSTHQRVALSMGADHPIGGLGLGQYGLHFDEYLPVVIPDAKERTAFWPVRGSGGLPIATGLHARVAAECGLIGMVLWAAIWILLFCGLIRSWWRLLPLEPRLAMVGMTLAANVIGLMIVAFAIDSFRFQIFWIILGAGWAYLARARGVIERFRGDSGHPAMATGLDMA